MRLWHKDLLPVLPRQQLLAQWRELCCIASNIALKDSPQHLLVNKVLDYPPLHFILYTNAVIVEMRRRGYQISERAYLQLNLNLDKSLEKFDMHTFLYIPNGVSDVYRDWHTDRYLKQCYYNLQEKYDCCGITKEDWSKIDEFVKSRLEDI